MFLCNHDIAITFLCKYFSKSSVILTSIGPRRQTYLRVIKYAATRKGVTILKYQMFQSVNHDT